MRAHRSVDPFQFIAIAVLNTDAMAMDEFATEPGRQGEKDRAHCGPPPSDHGDLIGQSWRILGWHSPTKKRK